jgi:hypothetical protein
VIEFSYFLLSESSRVIAPRRERAPPGPGLPKAGLQNSGSLCVRNYRLHPIAGVKRI